MKILYVASEVAPHAKTGGLADVTAALPRYLRAAGHDVRIFVPLYDRVDTRRGHFQPVLDPFDVDVGPHRYPVRIVRVDDDNPVHFVHCPPLYARGALYTHDGDEHRRFLALGRAALGACQRMGFAPDVIHCHDWQAAFLPLMLRTRFGWDRLFSRTRTLLTIHNLNYQGVFPASIAPDLDVADSMHLLHQDQLREGRIGLLLHGILYANGVSTVSPTYAREIQTAEHGAGLDGLLRARSSTVVGILNGVDYNEWSPETDWHLPERYSAADLAGKERCKQALLAAVNLPYEPGVPVFGIVSRLAGQKGLELLEQVVPQLGARYPFQLVVLGSGERRIEHVISRLAHAAPRRVHFHHGFSNPLAHLIEAGADAFLMPSRYEPCGLNQMYSLRYGTVPVVHKTGGLADTVEPWDARSGRGTGFLFEHHDASGLAWAMEQALRTYPDRAAWHRLMQNGMAQDFSWEAAARLYGKVYERLVAA